MDERVKKQWHVSCFFSMVVGIWKIGLSFMDPLPISVIFFPTIANFFIKGVT